MPHCRICRVIPVSTGFTPQTAKALAFVMNPDHRRALAKTTGSTAPWFEQRYAGLANGAGYLTEFGRQVRDHCQYLMKVRGQK